MTYKLKLKDIINLISITETIDILIVNEKLEEKERKAIKFHKQKKKEKMDERLKELFVIGMYADGVNHIKMICGEKGGE